MAYCLEPEHAAALDEATIERGFMAVKARWMALRSDAAIVAEAATILDTIALAQAEQRARVVGGTKG
jgi:hypothetical protein